MRSRSRIAVERVADRFLRGSGLLAVIRRVDFVDGEVLRALTYHRVVDPHDSAVRGDRVVISATPEVFADQVRLLARDYAPIGIPELEASLRDKRPLPRRAVLVTFDDSYRDFLAHAWPALKAHGVPAVLFVPTAYPDRQRLFWWDELWEMLTRSSVPSMMLPGLGPVNLGRPRGISTAMTYFRRRLRPLPPDQVQQQMAELRETLGVSVEPTSLVLRWEELRWLADEGVTIGSHGRAHLSMPSLSREEVIEEIDGAQEDITRELGRPAKVFAYPFGHYDRRGAEVLKSRGFLAAFGVAPGHTPMPPRDPFALARQSVNVEHSLSRLVFGLAGMYPPKVRLFMGLWPRALRKKGDPGEDRLVSRRGED